PSPSPMGRGDRLAGSPKFGGNFKMIKFMHNVFFPAKEEENKPPDLLFSKTRQKSWEHLPTRVC
ncbi:hypothetical protein, partial [uncultured Neisseria sp.]|uniref:hypothetical protein n=1 Tax=uncultured Neisseria sp. TaxID=237778 RepID=UPI0025ECD5E3